MPKEITLEDGTKQTFYEESEVNDFKTKLTQYETSTAKLRQDLGIKEDDSIEAKLAEMKELQNPNFAKFRKKFNAMEDALKNAGKEFDEDGNPITGNKAVSMEEIERLAMEATNKALSTKERDALLNTVPQDSRETVNALLSKLEATGGSLQENFQLALAKAMPGYSPDPIAASLNAGYGGGAPRIGDNKPKPFSETDEGKAMMNQIFPELNKQAKQ